MRIVPGAVDHQLFPMKMRCDPICFGGGIGEVGIARAHHHQNRRMNLGNSRLARSLRREDQRLGRLDPPRLLEVRNQRRAIRIEVGRRRTLVERSVVHRPERRPPRPHHRDFEKPHQERRGRNHARERIDHHDTGDAIGNLRGRPHRGSSGHRVAGDKRLARPKMPNQRDDIRADQSGRILGPIDARLAMPRKIHRDDPKPRGHQFRRKEPILLPHVPKPRHTDNQRPGPARIVICNLPTGQLEELR